MGNINVFTGPMKCGKSSKIIKTAYELKEDGKNVKVFKPFMDDRFSDSEVVDRNGKKIESININTIEDLSKYDADIYCIDEFQFLTGEIDSIKNMAKNGKKFYIAGLNLTAEKNPFGKMNDLIANSDNVEMMVSRCEVCNVYNAIYSFCTAQKTGDILIGDSEYIPVCENCYNKLSQEYNV